MMNPPTNKIPLDGIVLVNKPQGLTSNAVLQRVKRLFNAKKAGHTGSLDPLATGMLPICFGDATKFCQYVLDADKSYEVTGRLGIKTSTADSMGYPIASVDSVDVSRNALEAVLTQFIGVIQQVPSMYSALKHHGTPLYKLARAGIEIERKARAVTIHALQLHQFDGTHFDLTVTCSKGTYIRNLVEDIGECLQVGAHVIRLHRSYTAGFAHDPMFSLEALTAFSIEERLQTLLPMDRAVDYLPRLTLNSTQIQALFQGKSLSDRPEVPGCFRLYDDASFFIGLGDVDLTGQLTVRRLIRLASS